MNFLAKASLEKQAREQASKQERGQQGGGGRRTDAEFGTSDKLGRRKHGCAQNEHSGSNSSLRYSNVSIRTPAHTIPHCPSAIYECISCVHLREMERGQGACMLCLEAWYVAFLPREMGEEPNRTFRKEQDGGEIVCSRRSLSLSLPQLACLSLSPAPEMDKRVKRGQNAVAPPPFLPSLTCWTDGGRHLCSGGRTDGRTDGARTEI